MKQKSFHRFLYGFWELLGSMRFAVSLLTFVCIVSVIGTVLEQHQPEVNYIDQFGTFWYAVFSFFDVNAIYNAWWFLLVMGFLVVSTSICLIRNTPKMIKNMRNFREHIRETSFHAFPQRFEVVSQRSQDSLLRNVVAWLQKEHYSYKVCPNEDKVLVAAKKGTSNHWGYIFAHSAIVVICLGGLLDSQLPLQLRIWWDHKQPIPQNVRFVQEVPKDAIFGENTLSFRGNVNVVEGHDSNVALLDVSGDRYLQRLPFTVHLNKFIIDYYPNGMPKRFASDVSVVDNADQKVYKRVIEVNHPFTLHGITLYQSGFNDGGSKLHLVGHDLVGTQANFDLGTAVADTKDIDFKVGAKTLHYRLTVTDFRPLNVENLSKQKVNLEEAAQNAFMGSAAQKKTTQLRNVGPSFTYTLTDQSNQSIQFKNYMLPIAGIEPIPVFLLGVQIPNQGFSYLRLPADSKHSLQQFWALRAALNNPEKRAEAARAFIDKSLQSDVPPLIAQKLARKAMEEFSLGGFVGLDNYIDGVGVPEKDRIPVKLREEMRSILQAYLVHSAIELNAQVRQSLGLPKIDPNNKAELEQQAIWLDLALRGIADLTQYPSPIYFELKTFKHIQASTLQATRSPGEFWVYLGSIMLILGVFAMFFIRERRIWIWIKGGNEAENRLKVVMTAPKRNLDFMSEFEKLRDELTQLGNKEST